MKTQTSFILLFGIVMLTLAACDRKQSDPAKSDATGMPDPAAEHCVKAGGKPETKDLDNGDQSSICVMPDGKRCDAWIMKRENRCEEIQE